MKLVRNSAFIGVLLSAFIARMTFAVSRGVSVLANASRARQTNPQSKTRRDRRECVVLVHGLNRTALSMKPMEWFLKRHGYDVVNVTFPTRRCNVEELANRSLHGVISSRVPADATRVHFVTHSLGGIVVRQYLADRKISNLGRVVMLAPPNNGSEIADGLRRFYLGRCFLGKSGCQMGTAPEDVPRRLGPVCFDLGIIMGDCSVNPLYRRTLPSPNDGTVSVESAKVAGMKSFLVTHSDHTFIIWRAQTFRQVFAFLQRGSFSDASDFVAAEVMRRGVRRE